MLTDKFMLAPSRLLDMPSRDARHILAARSWCLLRKAALNPHSRVEGYLLSETVARRFGLLMETVTFIWPEPFGLHRPCCGVASVDEILFANSVKLAVNDHRLQFDRLLHEMLADEARDFFFARAQALYG
jgi:hypothetical protein